MTRPGDDRPTTVLPQQTVEQPTVTTGSETGRASTWHRRIPARIGRARTSTVVIGALFVLLGGLNFLLPTDPLVPRTLTTGEVVYVRQSQVSAPTTTAPPSDTPGVPVPVPGLVPDSPSPTSTSPAPQTTAAPEDPTPSSTAPGTTPTQDAETTAPSTSARPTATTRAPSTSAPATTAAPTPELVPVPTGATDPTG